MHGARTRTIAGPHQPRLAISIRAPQAAAFPARIRIVDASIKALGIEAHGVRDSQRDHLSVLQGNEAVTEIGGRDRNVLAEPERVVLVDPGVIARLGAGVGEAFETGAGLFVERPAFRTMVSCGGRAVERAFALAAVEAH